jgi:dTDP-glucose 4,6-dehydratase
MKVCAVGSGYVGLVTGACLADFGMQVQCVDKDGEKIAALRRGEIPIYEPGLRALVAKNVEEGRLSFSTELGPAIEEAQAIFIGVGTPPLPDGSADLTFIRQVAEAISLHLNGYKVIVTKSTVPIGTGQLIAEIIRSGSDGEHDFAVVSNPEFLREGSAIEDFLQPDRVVIGASDPRAVEIMLDIYSPLRVADVPFVITTVESAELIKYASNGFLATKISFINEIAELCEALGADVEVVARGMGLDARIGPRFLHPGPGFGGSCFPKDTRAVAQIARDQGLQFRIIEAVLDTNEATKKRMVHGRHSRIPGDSHRAGPTSRRRAGAGFRSRCHVQLPTAAATSDVLRQSVRGGDGSRRSGDPHRVESVQKTRAGPAAPDTETAAGGRSSKHLRAGEDGGGGVPLRLARPAGGASGRRGAEMTISLVTGGAGFLGSHLCERLLGEGHRVLCVDNLITGRRENIQHLEDRDDFRFIEQDVTRPLSIDEELDNILHFASPASPIDYLELPIQTLKVGSLGTHNTLGLAKAHDATYLLASTSEVYGDPLVHPQPEGYWGNVNPVGPRGVYDEAKRFAEAMVMAYHRYHGLDTRIARIFNTYGPRMRRRDGRVVPAFIQQALSGEPLTVFGDGSQTRSFCYVDDLISGIWRLLQSNVSLPVNLGNPHEMTILQFAQEIRKQTGSASELSFKQLPVDDPKTRQPDIALAREKLHWEPRVPLAEGLKKTVEYFRSSE